MAGMSQSTSIAPARAPEPERLSPSMRTMRPERAPVSRLSKPVPRLMAPSGVRSVPATAHSELPSRASSA